jgi:hypothetical protein
LRVCWEEAEEVDGEGFVGVEVATSMETEISILVPVWVRPAKAGKQCCGVGEGNTLVCPDLGTADSRLLGDGFFGHSENATEHAIAIGFD